ncbi:unnamed protein product [Aureobasidium mustum]|uniref:AB hydrolase-1 domain-containing protein n=1 Tax=Aureobasidium mustum TaxID=2773714 RepID=A0A9N8K265_9PEZI|nr:unnamed protein product [Aureobasidium mustum]
MMLQNCVQTPLGIVEVEVVGSGIPVMVLHGSPGGIDGARAMSQFLDRDRSCCIHLSRPGYLNTPLDPTAPSIDAEADLLAALLDTLDFARVGVLAWSGGGPPAYRLAARHPSRVSAMVIVAAISSSWVAAKMHLSERFVFGTRFGEHLISFLATHKPEHIVEEALKGEGTIRGEELRNVTNHVLAHPAQVKLIVDTARTLNIGGKRKPGWHNDVKNYADIKSLELECVTCPVLLVHGDADSDALPVYTYYAHARLPNSELIMMAGGTHPSFYAHQEAEIVQERAKQWFEHYSQEGRKNAVK